MTHIVFIDTEDVSLRQVPANRLSRYANPLRLFEGTALRAEKFFWEYWESWDGKTIPKEVTL